MRAARKLLGWSQLDLTVAADLAFETASKWESGKRTPSARTIDRVLRALEAAGVEVIFEGNESSSVKLREPKVQVFHVNQPRAGGVG